MRTFSFAVLAPFVLMLALSGCEELTPDEDTSCDPDTNSACTCTDDITGGSCVKGGANCTCTETSSSTQNNGTNNANNSEPAEVEVVPSPTSIVLSANAMGDADVASLCMTDPARDDPRKGLSLRSGTCETTLVAWFRVQDDDASTLYVGTNGIYTVGSYSTGDFGEAWDPSVQALAIPIDGSTDLVMGSNPMRQRVYQVAFTLNAAADQGQFSVEVATATATLQE